MTAMTEPIGLAEGRPFTVHDLEAMPDDGRRYELIDGMLLVTPAPGWSHQEMAATLYRALHAACPPELRVLLAPFAVRTAPINEVQPDVLVARYDDLTEACLPVAPVLAVEALSRSTQLNDRNTKKAHYERLGVPSYWLLDPLQPGGIEVYELDEQGRYKLTAAVSGDEVFAAQRPFPVQVCPARLLDGLRPR
jgi:Uma2 family endonuclease